jgi:mono/diheme cytochrome c family protein
MLTHHPAVHRCALAGLWLLISLGGRQLSGPTAIHAQADPSSSPQRPAPRPSASAAAGADSGRALFRRHCVKCHGADGTGSPARASMPEIPDFTDASWQARRSDARLLASILDGKGKEMPPWRG